MRNRFEFIVWDLNCWILINSNSKQRKLQMTSEEWNIINSARIKDYLMISKKWKILNIVITIKGNSLSNKI